MKRGLSIPQKRALAILARAAFEKQGFPGAGGAMSATAACDHWRREQCMIATGADGLSEASAADFERIEAHFAALAGDDARAFNAEIKSAQRERAKVSGWIVREIGALGESPSYANTIAQHMHRRPLGDCTPEQLRAVAIALTRERRRRAEKAALKPD